MASSIDKFNADLERDANDVGTIARAVVAKRVAIVAVVSVLLQLLVGYQVIPLDVSSHITSYINDGITALSTVIAVVYAQKGVTPTSDPRNDTGTKLVPATQVQAILADAQYDTTQDVPASVHDVTGVAVPFLNN